MRKQSIIILITVLASMYACTPKIIFNEALRNNLDLKSIKPEKLQFYIDRKIELRRENASNSTKVNSGKIELYKGKNIQIINIDALTPGICLRSSDSTLDIAFENNNDLYLQFKKIKTEDSDIKIYMLNTYKNEDGNTYINYGGVAYLINEMESEAKVLIKRKIANKENINIKSIKGRKLK